MKAEKAFFLEIKLDGSKARKAPLSARSTNSTARETSITWLKLTLTPSSFKARPKAKRLGRVPWPRTEETLLTAAATASGVISISN